MNVKQLRGELTQTQFSVVLAKFGGLDNLIPVPTISRWEHGGNISPVYASLLKRFAEMKEKENKKSNNQSDGKTT